MDRVALDKDDSWSSFHHASTPGQTFRGLLMGLLATAPGSIDLGEKKSRLGARIELNAYVTIGQTDEYGNNIWTSVGPFLVSSEFANKLVLAEDGLWKKIVDEGINACSKIAKKNHANIPNITAVGESGYWEKIGQKPPHYLRGPGYVYIFKVDGHDLFKVGISKNQSHDGRLSSINTASPFDVGLYREYRVSNMRRVEELAHARLVEFNTAREWFKCPAETVTEAVEWAMNKICSES